MDTAPFRLGGPQVQDSAVKVVLLGLCLTLSSPLAVAPAAAEIVAIEIGDLGPMGTFGGRNYTWVTATMEGTVERSDGSVGRYRVPITLNYPDRDSNGFGFVDVINDADFTWHTNETAGLGRPVALYTGDMIFSDFLRREGYTYVSVQWYFPAVAVAGRDYALIERPTDGNEIVRDAARLLRALDEHLPDVALQAAASEWVVAHGHSGSGGFLRGFIWAENNRDADGTLFYDGFIVTAQNAQQCPTLTDDRAAGRARVTGPLYLETSSCFDLPADGKFITLRTQSEVERRNNRVGGAPNERTYDVAGVAHVPDFISLLRYVGANRQNPVSWRPVARALLTHLAAWIRDGTEPPIPLQIAGEYDAEGQFHITLDADGNAVGGIRMPHLTTALADGEIVGAPLGTYLGVDEEMIDVVEAGYALLGGVFIPFSPDEIARRYPTQEVYVELVRRAAAQLLEQGFILPEDYDAYVRAAERERLYDRPNP